MKCCNAKGLFTGLLSNEVEQKKTSLKDKNKNDETIQDIPQELIRFNIKRQKLTAEELINTGEDTTYRVLGDPVYELEGSKDYLLCECKVCSHKRHAGNQHKYKAPCGCIITKKLCAVRVGHWTCNNCEKGFRDFPNNLYLFKFVHKDLEWLKFGYSKNPKHRKNDYKLIEGVEHELLVTHELPTGALAVEIENRIHGKYKEHNIPKEVMKKYMTESGFTETYPIELLPQFLEEFAKLKDLNE